MTAVDVNDRNFEQEVLGATETVVVDFWAPWCGPCKQIAPALDEIAAALQGRVRITKVNVDDSPEIAARYGIRSVPTLLVFKGGERIDQKVGAASKGDLSRWIGAHAA